MRLVHHVQSTDGFINYRECGGWVKGTGGSRGLIPLLGYAELGPKRDDEPGVDKPVREAIGCIAVDLTFRIQTHEQ